MPKIKCIYCKKVKMKRQAKKFCSKSCSDKYHYHQKKKELKEEMKGGKD